MALQRAGKVRAPRHVRRSARTRGRRAWQRCLTGGLRPAVRLLWVLGRALAPYEAPTHSGSNLPKLGRASHDAPGAAATGQPAENPVYRRHLARAGCATGSTAAQGAAQGPYSEHRVQLNGRLAVPVLIFLRASDYFFYGHKILQEIGRPAGPSLIYWIGT